MIHAYDEKYLDDAMRNLGEAVDYAVNQCKIEMDMFFQLFMTSRYAQWFGAGDPKYVSGMSGTELVWDILSASGIEDEMPRAQVEYDYSPEYWCGWILAYYQWYTGRPFKNIFEYVSAKDIQRLYPTMHEASERKFADTLNTIIRDRCYVTKLQLMRKRNGYSQRELSEKTGVNIRTLQQYEIGAKDINKAAAGTVFVLARVLNCNMEDLLEYGMEA